MVTKLPDCAFIKCDDPRHKPGVLRVTGDEPNGQPYTTLPIRVCVDCLHDAIDVLKESGITQINITAPEGPVYEPHIYRGK